MIANASFSPQSRSMQHMQLGGSEVTAATRQPRRKSATARTTPTVLHVINSAGVGGAERQLSEIVTRSSLNHEIYLLTAESDNRIRQVLGLRQRLRQGGFDLVVAWLDRSQIAVSMTAPVGTPLIAAVAGLPRRQGPRSRWQLRAAISRYDMTIFNSQASLNAMQEFMRPLKTPRVEIVHNAVPMEAPRMPADPQSPPRIGYIGRTSPDKGFDILLEALSRFRHGEIEVTAIGRGVPEAVAAYPQLEVEIEAIGHSAQPWATMRSLSALVVPSRTEGSPNVVIEAFAAGAPVIATQVGGTVELIGAGRGIGIPPEDPDAIATAIRQVIRERDRAEEQVVAARHYVEKEHSWPAVIERWDNLCWAVARGKAQ